MPLRVAGLIGLFVLLEGLTFCQSPLGSVTGVATDASESPVPNAQIVIANIETGVSNTGVTNESGVFLFPNLRPGSYKLSATATGFQPYETNAFPVAAFRTLRQDFRLQVAGGTTEITVSDVRATIVQTESPSIGHRLSHKQILELPTNLRSIYNNAGDSGLIFTMMPLTIPGVVQVNNGAAWLTPGSGANGVRLKVDGIDTNFGNFGGPDPVSQPSFESVEEFSANILTNKAEFGGMGQITTVTRGGTNQFHGSVFWYARNAAFDARNAFSPTKPFSNIHNFGGSVGGPLVKERTFLFATYDTTRGVRAYSFSPSVPTQPMRDGNFAGVAAIRNPFTGQAFIDNRIPSELLSPQALRIQELFFPLPNTPGLTANYRAGLNGPEDHHISELRLDHQVAGRHSLFGRYQFKVSDYKIPGARSTLPTAGTSQNHRDVHFFTVGDQLTIRPNLFNEFRAGLVVLNSESSADIEGQDVLSRTGIAGKTGFDAIQGIPNFAITGFSTVTQSLLNPVIDGRWQLSDNLTWISGRHSMKFGAELIDWFVNRYLPVETPRFGNFTFTNRFTGHPYADFLLGLPNQVRTLDPYPTQRNRFRDYNLYVQDDWKLRPRLTISYGLRYEYNPPAKAEDGNAFTFDPATGSVVIPSEDSRRFFAQAFPANLPVITADRFGVDESLRRADKNNFAPRLGFAYMADAAGRTIIRGGWGLYYGHYSGAVPAFVSAGPYSVSTTSTNAITNGQPLFTLAQPFAAASTPGVFDIAGVTTNLLNARMMQYSFTIERQFLDDYAVRISYIGSQGRQLPYIRNLNQPRASTEAFSTARRPYPLYNQVSYADNGANSSYNGLQVQAQRRFVRGLMFSSAWTWAKQLSEVDDTTNAELNTLIEDAYDRRRDRADVTAVPRHQWMNQALYELPFGFQVNAILNLSTGSYLNVVQSGTDVANVNNFTTRPDVTGAVNYPETEGRWYDASAFTVPPRGRFGNAARNLIRGPGYVIFNAGLLKNIHFEGARQLQFGLSFQNVLNHVNLGNPVLTTNVANAGQIGGTHIFPAAGSPRTGQASLRFMF